MVKFKTNRDGKQAIGIGLTRRELFLLLAGGSLAVHGDDASGVPSMVLTGDHTNEKICDKVEREITDV